VPVTALNLKTKLEIRTTTDAEGRFRLTSLPTGEYQVKVEAAAFRTEVVERVEVTPSVLRELVFRLGGLVPIPSPGPVPIPPPKPEESGIQVYDWKATGERELRQLLESMAAGGWALASVVPTGPERGFFHLEKATGAHYELVSLDEPLGVEILRREIEKRPQGRLVGGHRLGADKVLLIFRFTS